MHTIHRDAWGGHSQHFRKWGTQITPTAATRNKLDKFKAQWNTYVRGTTLGRGSRTRERRYISHIPPVEQHPLPPPRKERQHLPWFFKGAVPPPPATIPAPAWSGIGQQLELYKPLADMAQLSAGLLPLGRRPTPGPDGKRSPTPRKEEENIPKIPPLAVGGLKTSPISSCEDIPAWEDSNPQEPLEVDEDRPLDLSPSKKKDDLERAKEKRKLQTLGLEQEKQELQKKILEMDIKIEKLESIPLEQFNNIGNIGPPIKEDKTVRFEEPPASPPAPREEEAMDLTPKEEDPGTPPPPPLDAAVDVIESGVYTSEEEDIKETRRTSWAKRREAAQRKRLCLRLVKNKVGPQSLEVYEIPKTPGTPPSPLFPGASSANSETGATPYPTED